MDWSTILLIVVAALAVAMGVGINIHDRISKKTGIQKFVANGSLSSFSVNKPIPVSFGRNGEAIWALEIEVEFKNNTSNNAQRERGESLAFEIMRMLRIAVWSKTTIEDLVPIVEHITPKCRAYDKELFKSVRLVRICSSVFGLEEDFIQLQSSSTESAGT